MISNNNNHLISNDTTNTTTTNNILSNEEIDFILNHSFCGPNINIFNKEQLILDYTLKTANEMIQSFQYYHFEKYLPCLHIPGIGTRWQEFLNFLLKHFSLQQNSLQQNTLQNTLQNQEEIDNLSTRDCFIKFSNHLGKITTYRALALTQTEYEKIVSDNSIYPTGRLKTTKQECEEMVQQFGIYKICNARLYIGLQLVPFDPSLSLHDDPETTTCIASHYMKLPNRKVYLMKLNLPKIEVLGYKVKDVSSHPEDRWFYYGKIWFDSFNERTERYTLYEIPFFKERLQELIVFDCKEKINEFLEPFRQLQLKRKEESELL